MPKIMVEVEVEVIPNEQHMRLIQTRVKESYPWLARCRQGLRLHPEGNIDQMTTTTIDQMTTTTIELGNGGSITITDQPQKMDAELKREWIERLQSGNYPQGKNALKYIDSEGVTRYCCWGVYIDILVERGQAEWKDPSETCTTHTVISPNHTTEEGEIYPPHSLVQTSWQNVLTLADQNDGTRNWKNNEQTFEQIADWIKNHIEEE